MNNKTVQYYPHNEIVKWASFPISKQYEKEYEQIHWHYTHHTSNRYYIGGGAYLSSRDFIAMKLAATSNQNILFIDNGFNDRVEMNSEFIESLNTTYDLENTLVIYKPFYTASIKLEDLKKQIKAMKALNIPCYFIDFKYENIDTKTIDAYKKLVYHSFHLVSETDDKHYCMELFDFFFQDFEKDEFNEEQRIKMGSNGVIFLVKVARQYSDKSVVITEKLMLQEKCLFMEALC
jgi:hypothetical protein